jgi:hypothetical protein
MDAVFIERQFMALGQFILYGGHHFITASHSNFLLFQNCASNPYEEYFIVFFLAVEKTNLSKIKSIYNHCYISLV